MMNNIQIIQDFSVSKCIPLDPNPKTVKQLTTGSGTLLGPTILIQWGWENLSKPTKINHQGQLFRMDSTNSKFNNFKISSSRVDCLRRLEVTIGII